jgi:pimeloyl-ACP methyl ester carboxylesterase
VSDLAAAPFADALLGSRDLVVFDQRGTGLARPSLACPELTAVEQADADVEIPNPEGLEPLSTPDELDAHLRAFAACRERLVQQGVNLAAYTSATNAADVHDVVRALGYEHVNLWGFSYGSRLALTVMRDFPQIVRSVVIDGVVPLDVFFLGDVQRNAARAFDRLFERCAWDVVCNAAYPHLAERFYALVRRLEAAPAVVTVTDHRTGQREERLMVGRDVVGLIHRQLYRTEQIPLLPALIHEWADGSYASIAELLSPSAAVPPGAPEFGFGMNLSVNCADMSGLGSPETMAAAVAAVRPEIALGVTERYFERCAVWDVPGASPAQQQPLRSDVPTLVLSGEFDPITPPAYGQHAAATLTQRFVYTLPGTGHGAGQTPCGLAIMRAFWNAPTRHPDVSCIDTLTGPQWVLPGD